MTRRDGEDDDPSAPRRSREASPMKVAREMREMLGAAGIMLDEPSAAKASASAAVANDPDRAAIRALLEPLGVPEWMIVSCPSIALAQGYAERNQGKP